MKVKEIIWVYSKVSGQISLTWKSDKDNNRIISKPTGAIQWTRDMIYLTGKILATEFEPLW